MSFILEFKEEQRDAAKPSIDRTILEFFYLLGLPDPGRSAIGADTTILMIFGNPEDFAIEAMTEPHLVAPSAVWGRMCVHIGSVVLGDFSDEHCGLYSAYCGFKELLAMKTRLWDESFDGLSHEQIHDFVRSAIYGDDDREMASILSDSQRYRRFDFLTNWDEQFDGFASVIVQENDAITTILHRPHSAYARQRDPGPFVVAICSTIGFRNVCTDLVDWFDREAARLTRKEGVPQPCTEASDRPF